MFSVFFKKLFLLRALKPLISKQNPLAFDAAILVTPKRSLKNVFSLRGVETINFKVKPSGLRCSNTSTFIQSSRVSLETSRSLFWCLIGCNIGVRVKSDYFLIRYCFLKINVLNVTKTRCLRVYRNTIPLQGSQRIVPAGPAGAQCSRLSVVSAKIIHEFKF